MNTAWPSDSVKVISFPPATIWKYAFSCMSISGSMKVPDTFSSVEQGASWDRDHSDKSPSPNPLDRILIKLRIAGDDRHLLDNCLGDQQAVERVTMSSRELESRHLSRVSGGDRQDLEAILILTGV